MENHSAAICTADHARVHGRALHDTDDTVVLYGYATDVTSERHGSSHVYLERSSGVSSQFFASADLKIL